MIDFLKMFELYSIVVGFILVCLVACVLIQGATIAVIELIRKAFGHEKAKREEQSAKID